MPRVLSVRPRFAQPGIVDRLSRQSAGQQDLRRAWSCHARARRRRGAQAIVDRRAGRLRGAAGVAGLGIDWATTASARAGELIDLLTRAEEIAAERHQATLNSRPLSAGYRLSQTRGLLDEQLQAINNNGFSWVVYRLNPALRDSLTRIFRRHRPQRLPCSSRGQGATLAARRSRSGHGPRAERAEFRGPPALQGPGAVRAGLLLRSWTATGDTTICAGPTAPGRSRRLPQSANTSTARPSRSRRWAGRTQGASPGDWRTDRLPDLRGRELRREPRRHQAEALLDEFRDWTFDESNPVRSAARDFTDDWQRVTSGSGEAQDVESLID